MDCIDSIVFDLSLARGLDYYTGMIVEVEMIGEEIGSVGGGGRFDELIGLFTGKSIPATGGSIGIERVFKMLEKKYSD